MIARAVLAAALLAVLATRAAADPRRFVAGADVSSLPAVEAAGGAFADSGRAGDALAILAAHGLGAVRLRVWVDGADSLASVPQTIALARRAQALGLGVLVDLHYSDTWADPGRQQKPARWAGAHGAALADSVYAWTRGALAAMRAAGVRPMAVQIGNEVTNGMLWPDGQLVAGGEPSQWKRFAALLTAAARGVREGAPGARVLVHVDRGGDAAFVERFYTRLGEAHVPYDDIALSYYPWWHGSLDGLTDALAVCAESLHRDVWLVETAYPWTTRALDDATNLVGPAQVESAPFPATPEGQRAYLAQVLALVRRVPRGRGLFWWEPADVAAPRRGSVWENCALFDERGELLPAGRALHAK